MEFKICGITRLRDLQICEKFDPAFIGFINTKRSQRFIEIEKIREFADLMENREKAVLVVESETAEEVIKAVEKSGVKNVQLHSLSAEEMAKLKGITVIKVIGLPERIDDPKRKEIEEFAKVCRYLLFDSMISGKSGGTGKQIPLEVAAEGAEIAKKNNSNIKLFLAGGMNTERIKKEGKLIKDIFDYIDVNSGVEDSPGTKNAAKINEFVENCKVI